MATLNKKPFLLKGGVHVGDLLTQDNWKTLKLMVEKNKTEHVVKVGTKKYIV
jgi:hypothetical protein